MNWVKNLPNAPEHVVEVDGHTYVHDEDCEACQPGPDAGLCLPMCRCDGRLRGNECMGVINNEAQGCPKCKRRR